jgi:hypothetical protein
MCVFYLAVPADVSFSRLWEFHFRCEEKDEQLWRGNRIRQRSSAWVTAHFKYPKCSRREVYPFLILEREKNEGRFYRISHWHFKKEKVELHFVKKCVVSLTNNVLTVEYVILFCSFALFDVLEHVAKHVTCWVSLYLYSRNLENLKSVDQWNGVN